MNRLIIDGFDFGIDESHSHVKPSATGADIVVVGDDSVIQRLIETEDGPWSWLISAPMLYFREFAFSPCTDSGFSRDITDDDLDDYDIALYVMEHYDILPCRITLDAGVFKAVGNVHGIQKSSTLFDVCFTLPSA